MDRIVVIVAALFAAHFIMPVGVQAKSLSQAAKQRSPRCVVLDLYVSGDDAASQQAEKQLHTFVTKHAGFRVRRHDVASDAISKQRLSQLAQYFKVNDAAPLVYGCATAITQFKDQQQVDRQLQNLATLTVFVRSGCQHCAAAKAYLPELTRDYPALRLQFRDIGNDADARDELQFLVQKYRMAAASTPVFYCCDQLVIGFSSGTFTGGQLRTILNRWTTPCDAPQQRPDRSSNGPNRQPMALQFAYWPMMETLLVQVAEEDALPLPPLPDLPLPSDAATADEAVVPEEIELPLFGRLNARRLGLPLFTITVGLVDGFNPCAMWVLLFLLSVLVNLHSRWKILAVAGTFVVISAVAYFAFMAAWFSVFQFIGMLRSVQVALACLAILIGSVHIKDFFALHKGITFSIPESAKPGIYERVRRIVTAENLVGAVFAAAVLAVLVNFVELLCTAGLPALYTQILSARNFPAWKNYAYLLLYNAAYMFDDILMVSLVVITLEKRKLRETQGRWLKLLSGVAILGLGVVILIRPDWVGM
jgi:glutaredoxin